MLRIMKAFFPAVLACYVVASFLVTQFNLASLQALGIEIPLSSRLEATVHDLLGLASTYLVLILLGFILALSLASALVRLMPRWRAILYTLAGATALLALHTILELLLGLNGIAAVRTLGGLLAQGVAGAIGGFVFHRLSMPHSVREQLE